MLINASHPEENRVAIVVDGLLSELDIEIAGQEQTKGNIYKAVVVRVESGLQAAFVDYGAEKLGFLQIGEIHPNLYPPKDENASGRPRIADILHRGQEILVQIVKEERGSKGAALTTNLSIPGRYMVLMPDSTTKGVSRKIQDEPERKKLKRTMAELNLPERMGYIVRTAGIGKEKDELKRDFDYLVRLFEGIIARKDQIKAPAQLYQESNLVIRSIRDYFSTEMDEVLIDDQKVFQETKDFFSLVMPELSHLVKQHREKRPIFSRYQIEEQIETLSKNQIPLPSGGSIVIDQTEALVAIDVNSGKMSSESGIEATAVKTNLEAAAEVGRQLRLRDLGGLVVIDFIDMRDRKHIREVEQELRKALRDDKAKVSVGRISQFGLMEMSRQRLKPTLSVGSYLECPHCQGKGRIKSAENQAVGLLRQIHAAASKGHIGHIEAWVPLDVANDLLNRKRQSLVELEQKLNLQVTIFGRAGMMPGQLDMELHRREKSIENDREIAPVTHANQIESALAAAQQDVPAENGEKETVENPENQEGDDTTEPKAEEKKSRRRRRRRRKKTDRKPETEAEQSSDQSSETESPDTPAAETQPQEAEAFEQKSEQLATETSPAKADEKSASTSTETGEKPKRRSRRPARKKEPAQETNGETEVKTEVSETAAEETPKRRPRRSSKKTEEKPATEAAQEAVEQPATEEEKPKRRPGRPRKKPAEKKVDSPEETTPDAKPKPGTGQAVKKTAEPIVQKTTAAPEKAETTAVEEKPKRRPGRPRKKTVKEPAEATASEAPAEEKPKPRTRRTSSRTTAAKSESADKPAENTETPATEEKPKRRPGRPRKKPAEKTSEEKSEAQTEEKPKRRPGRPRKTVAKKEMPEDA
ncbi:RNAse E [Malonomonas rubra DSM 5091]|uniref:Ribonuclease G n=2 Tax=Malonomonas rubra TaxID=57040 RepID=A0A1M6C569_MALRU|nr:RNAse E [Malonomonas rubra DSM 5091]